MRSQQSHADKGNSHELLREMQSRVANRLEKQTCSWSDLDLSTVGLDDNLSMGRIPVSHHRGACCTVHLRQCHRSNVLYIQVMFHIW